MLQTKLSQKAGRGAVSEMDPQGRPRRSSHERQPHFMKAWREAHGWTLKQMATAINVKRGYQMATVPSLSRIENGERQYTQDLLEAYAEVLGITPADLLSYAPRDPEAVWADLMATAAAMQTLGRELKARRPK